LSTETAANTAEMLYPAVIASGKLGKTPTEVL